MVLGGGVGLFVDHKKGEIPELKSLLRDSAIHKDPKQKRLVMERVVGYMTLGIDMSPLFSEMTMATATQDLVQKKMAYLYLSNYASLQADLALLVINTLQKDSRDEDPMVRGLALRCLCSLHVNNLEEYIIEPIVKGLDDPSPYVRKSAVMCVLRVKELSTEAVRERRLVEKLFAMIKDRDQQVVVNAMHVLLALQGERGMEMMLSHAMVVSLLQRLREFNEWSQCLVLHVVSHYKPESDDHMFEVMNFLDERLRHNNSAVVLAAVRVFLRVTIDSGVIHYQALERVRAPLITLMTGGSPETAYILLKHILVLSQRAPGVFEDEYSSFFVRYSDPPPIQDLKIQVLAQLADSGNCASIIREMSALVSPYDPELSRRSIQAIGKISVKVTAAAPLAIEHLETFLRRGSPVVCEQAISVAVNIARRYPGQVVALLPHLPRAHEVIKEPESRRALIWLLGQYGVDIPQAPYLLEETVDDWEQEADSGVKLELLTACVKLAFKRPAEMQGILGRLLKMAVDDSSNVDLHDRALFYYRLLHSGVEEAKGVIEMAERDACVVNFAEDQSMQHRDALFEDFGTLSVVYGQPAANWLRQEEIEAWNTLTDPAVDVHGVNLNPPLPPAPSKVAAQPAPPSRGGGGGWGGGGGDMVDLSDLGFVMPTALVLDHSATVTPQAFQEAWMAIEDEHTSKYAFPMTPAHGEIEGCLGAAGVKLMATGSAGAGHRKYFFYALPQGNNMLCMCEALLDETFAIMTCKYKTQDPDMLTRIALTFRSSLQSMGIQ